MRALKKNWVEQLIKLPGICILIKFLSFCSLCRQSPCGGVKWVSKSRPNNAVNTFILQHLLTTTYQREAREREAGARELTSTGFVARYQLNSQFGQFPQLFRLISPAAKFDLANVSRL